MKKLLLSTLILTLSSSAMAGSVLDIMNLNTEQQSIVKSTREANEAARIEKQRIENEKARQLQAQQAMESEKTRLREQQNVPTSTASQGRVDLTLESQPQPLTQSTAPISTETINVSTQQEANEIYQREANKQHLQGRYEQAMLVQREHTARMQQAFGKIQKQMAEQPNPFPQLESK